MSFGPADGLTKRSVQMRVTMPWCSFTFEKNKEKRFGRGEILSAETDDGM